MNHIELIKKISNKFDYKKELISFNYSGIEDTSKLIINNLKYKKCYVYKFTYQNIDKKDDIMIYCNEENSEIIDIQSCNVNFENYLNSRKKEVTPIKPNPMPINPSEYYFKFYKTPGYKGHSETKNTFAFVPISYWETYKELMEEGILIQLLNFKWSEYVEGVWQYDGAPEDAIIELKSRGFIQNQKLPKYIIEE